MTRSRKLGIAAATLAVASLVAADSVLARGGGGRGGGRGGGAGAGLARAARSARQKTEKKDLEAARERLRQMDYRDQDATRDRGVL